MGLYIADTHCHILYGVDDGAKSREMMFSMLDEAYENGVRLLCATPHYNPGLFRHDPEKEKNSFEELSRYAGDKYPDLDLYKGNEVFVYVRLPSFITESKDVCLAETKKLLVEFRPDISVSLLLDAVGTIFTSGFVPVLAHVERYGSFKEKYVIAAKERGAIITVNAESVIGKNGNGAKRLVHKLIKHGIVDIVVSDAHRPGAYSSLGEAFALVTKKYGTNAAEALFKDNVYKIYKINSRTKENIGKERQ